MLLDDINRKTTPCGYGSPPARGRRMVSGEWRVARQPRVGDDARVSAISALERNRHGRACPGHPRSFVRRARTWMPGTSPGMTVLGLVDGAQNCSLRLWVPACVFGDDGW